MENGVSLNSSNVNRNIDHLSQLSSSKIKPQDLNQQTPLPDSPSPEKTTPKDLVDVDLYSKHVTRKTAKNEINKLLKEQEPIAKQNEKEVTFLYYLDGQYPDLESTMASVPIGLESVGSNKDMNIVVELGRAPQSAAHPEGGFDRIDTDWEGVRRYFINQTDSPRTDNTKIGDWVDISKEHPDNPLIHYVLGELYESGNLKDEADKEFKKAEELGYMKFFRNPNDPMVKQWGTEFQKAIQPLRDKNAASNIYNSPVVSDLGQGIDMKHPHNLQDFVSWGIKKYPAKHYVVILGGHGGAWTGALQMSPSDIGMAIQAGNNQANRATGRNDKIDALVFNSCYMGNLESLQEMKDAADVIIASEMSAKSNVLTDWPAILTHVKQDLDGNSFNVKSFAKDMVSYYNELGDSLKDLPLMKKFSKEHYLTLAAVDTSKIDDITASWNKLILDWKKLNVLDQDIYNIINTGKNYPSFAYSPEMLFDYGTLRDIGDIADKLSQAESLPTQIRKDASLLREALDEAIIAEQHTGHDMENSSGLSIWAPTNASDIALMASPYGKRVPSFVQNTNWDKKLVEAVKKADQQKLSMFMATIKKLAQSQQELRNNSLSADERQKLEQMQAKLQAEAVKLREELSIAKRQDEPEQDEKLKLVSVPVSGEKEGEKEKGKEEEYIEGHIKSSQAQDGMSHGKGLLADSMLVSENDEKVLENFTEDIIRNSQIHDGMGHNPKK